MKSLFLLNTIVATTSGAILSFLSGHTIMFVATFGICYWGLIVGILADKIITIGSRSNRKISFKPSHIKI
ncbi:MAG TPA: hypothetical protein H9979_03050 [Candidatus Megamonas gallistercoris]|nr:hypothetical protein [Candidatus Megamonas gallistercoris]